MRQFEFCSLVESEPVTRFCHVSKHRDLVRLNPAKHLIHPGHAKMGVLLRYDRSAALFVRYVVGGNCPHFLSRCGKFDDIPKVDKLIVTWVKIRIFAKPLEMCQDVLSSKHP